MQAEWQLAVSNPKIMPRHSDQFALHMQAVMLPLCSSVVHCRLDETLTASDCAATCAEAAHVWAEHLGGRDAITYRFTWAPA